MKKQTYEEQLIECRMLLQKYKLRRAEVMKWSNIRSEIKDIEKTIADQEIKERQLINLTTQK
tara:strand:- start:5412 stop:5597 length:186 start_codon:yes stop_codon:yes gene_type:complete